MIHVGFGVLVNYNSINYGNSGIETRDNLDLDELEQRINKIISDIGQHYNNANPEKREIIRKFQKHTYLAYTKTEIKINNTRFTDDVLKEFLHKINMMNISNGQRFVN
jgi:hypothetical protein